MPYHFYFTRIMEKNKKTAEESGIFFYCRRTGCRYNKNKEDKEQMGG
jgi:hypothetical protein